MKKREKGEFGYLKYRKQLNLIKMAAAFLIVILVLTAGILVTKTRYNAATVAAIVLVLPAAKMAVAYFVLLPHQPADQALADAVEKTAVSLGICYDCIFSNSKKPIGTQAVVVTDSVICALTNEEKADTKLFETSVRDFLANDKLHVTVTLYKDEKAFLNRVHGLAVNFKSENQEAAERMQWNLDSMKAMCL